MSSISLVMNIALLTLWCANGAVTDEALETDADGAHLQVIVHALGIHVTDVHLVA